MSKSIFFIALASCFILFSCSKKTPVPEACFKFSQETAKLGDTVYLINCSKNFDYSFWLVPQLGATPFVELNAVAVFTTPAVNSNDSTYNISVGVSNTDLDTATLTQTIVVSNN
jgi:hypothetical protein